MPEENQVSEKSEQPELIRAVGVSGATTLNTIDINEKITGAQAANHETEEKITAEKPNAFWYRVYLAVIVTTVLVIAALRLFSIYFSK